MLCTNQAHPLNGEMIEAMDSTKGRVHAGGDELHLSVDLTTISIHHLPRSDPCSDYSKSRRGSSLQLPKEEEEETVDVDRSCAATIMRLPEMKTSRRVHHDGNVEDEKAKAKDKRESAASPAAPEKEGSGGGAVAAEATARCDDESNGANAPRKEKKRRRSPGAARAAVLMEGSRCSRVNGRGWRCCQQTLVGYSLCEHHLGKGRLRSVSSVRGQLGTSKPTATDGGNGAVPLPQEEKRRRAPALAMSGADEMEDEEMERKKRKKARSISSLLDSTCTNPSASSSTLLSPSHCIDNTTASVS